jgi:excisionase family DNA binding protein
MIRKKFLSVEDTCTYLDLSPSAVYKLSHNRTIPVYCPNGKKIYFLKDDIDAWILKHKILSDEELSNELLNIEDGGKAS